MELLQELSGAETVATMLMSGRLRVVHLTTHRSLRRAVDYVTRDRIFGYLELTHRSFEEWGMPNCRIGVAALNPHGSDGGLLGDERSVTANLGLPFVRTSVDHGTAFDIAGKGIADHQSMLEAVNLAVSLSRGRGLP